MKSTVSDLVRIFTHGLGLRISLSFLPPIILTWIFFVMYLGNLVDDRVLRWAATLGLLGIAIGSAVVVWLVLNTIPPIRRIIDVTGTLAHGELAVDIPYLDQPDETGDLARALEVFKRHVLELKGVAAIKAEKEGDIGKRRELLSLADALEGEVQGTVKQVMTRAETMTSSAGDVAEAIRRMQGLYTTLAAASSETLDNINAVAAATDQLASAGREIAGQMARTIGITQEAVSKAEEADSTMRELASVSTRIGEVLQIISLIARQTNLLALNATIEAARAGDAGKGFAVVANEVKTLASQTARAVDTITEQVDGIRVATENGVQAIGSVGHTIQEVNSVATAVAAAVEQQEAATRNISSNAQKAALQAKKVSGDASSISTEVVNVDNLAGLMEKGAGEVTNNLNTMERRLSGILVRTVGDGAKGKGRAGSPVQAVFAHGGVQQPCRLEQMELESARLVGIPMTAGAEIDLTVDDFGPLRAKVRETGASGSAVDFLLDSVTRARLGEFLYGHQAADQPYIKLAKASARKVERIFEAALAKGEISVDALFDRDYQPIPGSNPQQLTTAFLSFAERVLPPIQEEILKADPKVVFGLAINQDGYVSAHHLHCSQPQGPDPVWNAANCRNRRLFNNQAELAGVTHTQDYLLQTYIRDMGGGKVMLLKDASAPITVRGRHWGGLRLGYNL